jgi:hypothetical protein
MIRKGLMALRIYRRLASRISSRIAVEEFDLKMNVGLGRAEYTAQVVGWLNAALGWWCQTRILPRAVHTPTFRVEACWDGVAIDCHWISRIRIKGWMIGLALMEAGPLGLRDMIATLRRQRTWQKFRQIFTT